MLTIHVLDLSGFAQASIGPLLVDGEIKLFPPLFLTISHFPITIFNKEISLEKLSMDG